MNKSIAFKRNKLGVNAFLAKHDKKQITLETIFNKMRNKELWKD